jgi:hypothetical protein
VSRRDWNDDALRGQMEAAVRAHSRTGIDAQTWSGFARRWHYHRVEAEDAAAYRSLARRLEELERQSAGLRGELVASRTEREQVAQRLIEVGAVVLAEQGRRVDAGEESRLAGAALRQAGHAELRVEGQQAGTTRAETAVGAHRSPPVEQPAQDRQISPRQRIRLGIIVAETDTIQEKG